MKITVPEEFIWHRAEKMKLYNQRGRTDRKFAMDIDCEIIEWYMIKHELWWDHPDWKVDAITPEGQQLDVKVIQKYWNLSGSKITNIIQQRRHIHEYHFYEWVYRPGRPFETNDEVQVRLVGILPFDVVADNIRPSFKAQGQYYLDVRELLGQDYRDNR